MGYIQRKDGSSLSPLYRRGWGTLDIYLYFRLLFLRSRKPSMVALLRKISGRVFVGCLRQNDEIDESGGAELIR